MVITEKQALTLIMLLINSLSKEVVGYLSLSIEQRARLLSEILNQQNDERLIKLTIGRQIDD